MRHPDWSGCSPAVVWERKCAEKFVNVRSESAISLRLEQCYDDL